QQLSARAQISTPRSGEALRRVEQVLPVLQLDDRVATVSAGGGGGDVYVEVAPVVELGAGDGGEHHEAALPHAPAPQQPMETEHGIDNLRASGRACHPRRRRAVSAP